MAFGIRRADQLFAKADIDRLGCRLTWTLAGPQFGSSEVGPYGPAPLVNATVTATQALTGLTSCLHSVWHSPPQSARCAARRTFGATTVSPATTRRVRRSTASAATGAPSRTLGTNQTLTHQWVDNIPSNQTFLGSVVDRRRADAGTVATINDPRRRRPLNIASIEILAGSASPAPSACPMVGVATARLGVSLRPYGRRRRARPCRRAVISQNPVAGTQVVTGSAVVFLASVAARSPRRTSSG